VDCTGGGLSPVPEVDVGVPDPGREGAGVEEGAREDEVRRSPVTVTVQVGTKASTLVKSRLPGLIKPAQEAAVVSRN
jgi:hypothetical protein